MPRLVVKYPSYRHHKNSGQAVVTLNGRDVYLGSFGTQASRDNYDRVIAEWLAAGRQVVRADMAADLCISEVINAFRKYADDYYRRTDGTPTSEAGVYRYALRPLRRLFGRTPVTSFGPLALQAVADEMIRLGWSRGTINRHLSRIKHMFKWATARELIPTGIYHGLQAMTGLKAGRSKARETMPVKPVPNELVEAVLKFVSSQVDAMIRLQLLTGMRPGEVCAMRAYDLDTSEELWSYRPGTHKTAHHGHQRVIYLGPKAQQVVRPFLKIDMPAYLFSPAEAESARRQIAHAARKTPLSCGNVPGSNCKRRLRRRAGDRYDVAAYRRAVARACDRAFPPPDDLSKGLSELEAQKRVKRWRSEHRWHPHQLRHNAATTLRREYGLEAAQVILGHKTLSVTEIYAEKNIVAARRIMSEVG